MQFYKTGGLCFGTVIYDVPVWNSCTALVRNSTRTHWAGVYGVHGVWCANALCAPVHSLVERTSAVYDDNYTG